MTKTVAVDTINELIQGDCIKIRHEL